ncbi:alpha/beta fold hydrolase [Microbacterium lacticum]
MLVLLPAMGVPAGYYQRLVSQLTALGLPVVQVRFEPTGADLASAISDYAEAIETRIPAALDRAMQLDHLQQPVMVGHSLGGQLGLIAAGVHAPSSRMILLASGTAHYAAFAGVRRGVYLAGGTSIGMFAEAFGSWPGHFFRFGGRQQVGVIQDWSHNVRTGRYSSSEGAVSYDHAIADFNGEVLAITVRDDVLATEQATRELLSKAPAASVVWERYVSQRGKHRPGAHFTCVRDLPGVAPMIAQWARKGGDASHEGLESRSLND